MSDLKIYTNKANPATFERHKRAILEVADFLAGLAVGQSQDLKHQRVNQACVILEQSMELRGKALMLECIQEMIQDDSTDLNIPAIERVKR